MYVRRQIQNQSVYVSDYCSPACNNRLLEGIHSYFLLVFSFTDKIFTWGARYMLCWICMYMSPNWHNFLPRGPCEVNIRRTCCHLCWQSGEVATKHVRYISVRGKIGYISFCNSILSMVARIRFVSFFNWNWL